MEFEDLPKKQQKRLLNLNYAAGLLHLEGIVTHAQRRSIHTKLMKLRDKLLAQQKNHVRQRDPG